MRALAVGLGVSVILGGVLSGCSFQFGVGTPTVSSDALQEDIRQRLNDAGENPESVTCAEDLVGEVGATSRCAVVISATNSFEPVVTVTGVDGRTINYEMTPALSKGQLEAAVSRNIEVVAGVGVDSVSCESGLDGEPGALAYCDVDAGGVQLRRTVEVTEVDGLLMNFALIPLLTQDEVESSLLDQLEYQLGQRPESADCDGGLEGRPGTTVGCTVTGDGEVLDFVLTVTSVEDDIINYRFESVG